ncbi:hypothetical protein A8U91_04029 [Halomonas elongata]|uniref:Uncharacterized protein n=1 Tax=Halomonas elongata TaxID=2746 RepID=A0A1B8NY73_HALEL|nr:hypothetical protein A8U91_04029 [Halomonas elongata]
MQADAAGDGFFDLAEMMTQAGIGQGVAADSQGIDQRNAAQGENRQSARQAGAVEQQQELAQARQRQQAAVDLQPDGGPTQ